MMSPNIAAEHLKPHMETPHGGRNGIMVVLSMMLIWPSLSWAETGSMPTDLAHHWLGYLCLTIFLVSYVFVVLEEKLHLRKSKPVLLAAGLIWIIIAISQLNSGQDHLVEAAIKHNLLEYAELFFFLLVAMTYINAMADRDVFDHLRDVLIKKGFSFKQLFWITGALAFVISPLADNLTTALILCAVVLAVGRNNTGFISLSCINIVVAANAGGAFSPFGDITTLMVWQKGVVPFERFFDLMIPAFITYVIPASIMSFFIVNDQPQMKSDQYAKVKKGGYVVVGLFMLTIFTAVTFHSLLDLPPVFGMMFGLGFLKIYAFFLNRKLIGDQFKHNEWVQGSEQFEDEFDVFDKIARSEWDTLFFFYGVILAVGGLGFLGYLAHASEFFYGQFGATTANVLVGVLSAFIDNIPVMYAVLTMNPEMPQTQWLLVTLTAGVGGSLLAVGSAAGVALMGQARGYYTFFRHLKWTPVIALGYAAGIMTHLFINQ